MPTSLESWQAISQRPPIVEFFRGLFDVLGVRVCDTKESFTCIHKGDRIEFSPKLNEERVDFTLTIVSEQVRRLVEDAADGTFDAAEQFRIFRAFFSPAAAATLKNPLLSHPVVRKLSGAEDLIHVTLQSPVPAEESYSHTLVYAARQWLVFPGVHGQAKRHFHLNMEQALEYHRRALAAIKENKLSSWMTFSKWYRKWRTGVSERK